MQRELKSLFKTVSCQDLFHLSKTPGKVGNGNALQSALRVALLELSIESYVDVLCGRKFFLNLP